MKLRRVLIGISRKTRTRLIIRNWWKKQPSLKENWLNWRMGIMIVSCCGLILTSLGRIMKSGWRIRSIHWILMK